jgi:hypothetical protein
LLEQHTEVSAILYEPENAHNDIRRTRVRHEALYLPRLIHPEMPDVLIDWRTRLPPQAERVFFTSSAVPYGEDYQAPAEVWITWASFKELEPIRECDIRGQ